MARKALWQTTHSLRVLTLMVGRYLRVRRHRAVAPNIRAPLGIQVLAGRGALVGGSTVRTEVTVLRRWAAALAAPRGAHVVPAPDRTETPGLAASQGPHLLWLAQWAPRDGKERPALMGSQGRSVKAAAVARATHRTAVVGARQGDAEAPARRAEEQEVPASQL